MNEPSKQLGDVISVHASPPGSNQARKSTAISSLLTMGTAFIMWLMLLVAGNIYLALGGILSCLVIVGLALHTLSRDLPRKHQLTVYENGFAMHHKQAARRVLWSDVVRAETGTAQLLSAKSPERVAYVCLVSQNELRHFIYQHQVKSFDKLVEELKNRSTAHGIQW